MDDARKSDFSNRLGVQLHAFQEMVLQMHHEACAELEHSFWQSNGLTEGASARSEPCSGLPADYLKESEFTPTFNQEPLESIQEESSDLLRAFNKQEEEAEGPELVLAEDLNKPSQASSSCASRISSSSGVVRRVQPETAHDLVKELPYDVMSRVIHALDETEQETRSRLHILLSKFSYAMLRELVMFLIVVSNVLVLGLQAGSDWHGWFYVNVVYTGIFTVEFVIHAFHSVWYGKGLFFFFFKARDRRWHWFDLILVFLQSAEILLECVQETGRSANTTMIIRFARLFRMARLLHVLQLDICRDLMMMVDGAVGGMRTLGWSIVLLTLPIYAFSLLLTESLAHEDLRGPEAGYAAEHFGTMSRAFFTSFRCLVMGDCSARNGTPLFPLLVEDLGWGYGALYVLSFLCMNFGLFNVIVAIYVDNTQVAAKSNEMLQRHRRLEDRARFAEHMLVLTRFLWIECRDPSSRAAFDVSEALNMEVTKETWEKIIQDPKLGYYLHNLDVRHEDHMDLFEICDSDGSGLLTVDELVMGIRKLRGDPRRSDLVYVMLRVRELRAGQEYLSTELNNMKTLISKVPQSIDISKLFRTQI